MLDKITVLLFSPTGGTQRAAMLLAERLAHTVQQVDLSRLDCAPHAFDADDVVLAAGRIPALMA